MSHGICSIKFPHCGTGVVGVVVSNECNSLRAIRAIVEETNALNSAYATEKILINVSAKSDLVDKIPTYVKVTLRKVIM